MYDTSGDAFGPWNELKAGRCLATGMPPSCKEGLGTENTGFDLDAFAGSICIKSKSPMKVDMIHNQRTCSSS